jgi:FXSXX-COOH protein
MDTLDDLDLDQLATDEDAAHIVARLTRDREEAEPVRVAAFNSFI